MTVTNLLVNNYWCYDDIWYSAYQIDKTQCWCSVDRPALIVRFLSQCSTLVRNTVVRAILQAYGKLMNFDPLGSRNCWTDWHETWHGWLCRWPHPTCTKRKVYVKEGGCLGVGWNVQPKRAFFFFPFSFFWFPERTSSLPGKDWLGALCTQKRVLVVSWFL